MYITMNGAQGDTLNLGDMKAYVSQAPFTLAVTARDPATGQIGTWTYAFPNANYYGTWFQGFVLGLKDLHF
jgi:hypothetical protein